MKIKTVLDYENLFTHCSLAGTTGSGKTTYMKAIIQDVLVVHKNNNILFIDGKNDHNLKESLESIALNNDYKFLYFSNAINSESNFNYHCLQNKSFMEIKEIINRLRMKDISNVSLGANYYLTQSNKLLFLIVKMLLNNQIDVSWKNLDFYCNKNNLKTIILDEYKSEMYSFNDDTYNDALAFIRSFSEEYKSTSNDMSLNTILKNSSNQIILISLDLLSYPTTSKQLAQAICLDLRQSIRYKTCDLFCFLDEFGSYINQDLKTILEQGRSYKVSLILAYQSLAQIDKDNFKNIVFDNTNNWFIFHMKHEESIKEMVAIFGIRSGLEFNYSLNLKNKNMVNKYVGVRQANMNVVAVNDVKNLKPLECFIKTVKEPGYLSMGIELENK